MSARFTPRLTALRPSLRPPQFQPLRRPYSSNAPKPKLRFIRPYIRPFLLGASAACIATLVLPFIPKYSLDAPPAPKPGVPVTLSSPSTREKALGVELIPSGTSSVPDFPRTLTDATGTEYALVGLGIRTVSFLSIQVYVVGFYIAANDLQKVQKKLLRVIHPTASAATVNEVAELRGKLLDHEEGERIVRELLKPESEGGVGFRSLLRVVPTRNTDWNHLRDGWVRGIQAEAKIGGPEYELESFDDALQAFREMFKGRGSVPKQKTMLLRRDEEGRLSVAYDKSGRNDGFVGEGERGGTVVDVGRVADERVARALWLAYFAGKKVASEPLRANVVEGLCGMVERPVGTLGTARIEGGGGIA